jgi:hypothetical protein
VKRPIALKGYGLLPAFRYLGKVLRKKERKKERKKKRKKKSCTPFLPKFNSIDVKVCCKEVKL